MVIMNIIGAVAMVLVVYGIVSNTVPALLIGCVGIVISAIAYQIKINNIYDDTFNK